MTIVSAILAFIRTIGQILGLIQVEQERQAGRQEAAAAVSSQSATTQAAIAQAATDAPRTASEIINRLRAGNF